MEQGTSAWFQIRCGRVTASRIGDLMAKTNSGYSASRKNYLAQIVVETLTQTPTESYTNAAMQWGTDTEPYAREAYEMATGNIVEEVGFVIHPDINLAGASPDGLVGDDGLIEIKCPNTATHIETLLSKKVDRKYLLQMQWQMACTDRDWCDFVSYDPRMPENLKFHCTRINRDDELVTEIVDEVAAFLNEVAAQVSALTELQEAA